MRGKYENILHNVKPQCFNELAICNMLISLCRCILKLKRKARNKGRVEASIVEACLVE
jgi:hypothetical protein